MQQPTLETGRLILRPLRIEDFDRYVEIWQNEVIVRHITGAPISREVSWGRLLRATGHWQWLGFGYFGVVDKASGLLIGEAGVQDMRREITPSLEGTLEAGWGLLPEFHGRGLAHEAASTVIGWAERALPPMEFTAIIDPDNIASQRLALKLGFVRDCETDYAGSPTVIYRRPGIRQDGPHSAPSYPPRN
nr:GNAT family N-acetyltransferase [uncultured Gellertiella sp.]